MGKVQAFTIPKKFVDLSKLVIVGTFLLLLLLLDIEKERPCCCLVHCKKKSSFSIIQPKFGSLQSLKVSQLGPHRISGDGASFRA